MADTVAHEAGHPEASEPPSPPTLHSLPTEVLTMIFRFLIFYDHWDRGPLQKRTTQYLHEIATLSRLCKRFNKVIHHEILYQHIQFPRELGLDDEQDPDGSPLRSDDGHEQDAHPPAGVDELRLKRMEKLLDLFWERSDLRLPDLVRGIRFSLPGRTSVILAAKYMGIMARILACTVTERTEPTLIRARIALPTCSKRGPIPVDPSRITPRLANLTHLVVESGPSWSHHIYSPAYVPQGLLNQVVSWATNIHTLILRQLDNSDLADLTLAQTLLNLIVLELEQGYISDGPFPYYTPSGDRLEISGRAMPLRELLTWCPRLRNLRINPRGPAYRSELSADATGWDPSTYRDIYTAADLEPSLGEERETVFRTFRLGDDIEDDPSLEMQPWEDSGHPGLDILDAIIGSSGSSKTLERIHLGDARQIKTLRHIEAPAAEDPQETPFTLSPTADPEYWLPCLKFLSIHCSNILMVCHGESRKILEDIIFTNCPKLESLEVTGLKAEPEMIHRVLLPLERGIIRTGRSLARPNLRNVQESLPGLMNLAKVTLVTANATETLWLFTTVTCRVYLEGFASAGVQLALVRRGTKFLKADFVRPFVEQVLSLA
ncbi:hypothetical protein V8F06_009272 [Rhypophila decipiens]